MRLTSLVLVATCVLLPTTAARSAEPKQWALLVGVNDYVNFRDLAYAGADASALGEALVLSGFDPERVFLLNDASEEARYKPFKKNIEKQLDIVLKVAGPDDTVIVSFSGHGIHIDGKSYFCPSEADDESPDETMIAVDDIYKKFESCPAALKLMVVDACRDDPRPPSRKSAKPDDHLKNFGGAFQKPPDGLVVLSSCGPGQKSYEDEQFRHGVFMYYVLQGLAGDADGNSNGVITLGELYDYASTQTKVYVAKTHNDYQVPAQRGEINGVFELPRSLPPPEFTNTIGMKFSVVPNGEFLMGSDDSDVDAKDNEKPQHRVRISRPFYLGTFEVTRGQFEQFVKAENYLTDMERAKGGSGYSVSKNDFEELKPQYSWRNPGYDQTDHHPVVNVTWNDAQAFCAWLSKLEGKTYRLPTEAEWESACRAGTTTRYHHGDDPSGVATVANTYDAAAFELLRWKVQVDVNDRHVFTAQVGRYQPNAYGLYDMHGNVDEWCADRYQAFYEEQDATDPAGPEEGDTRVIRGGSWYDYPSLNRSAYRTAAGPAFGHYATGFRVALTW
jgi:formylglycine-generating enzyme required for sulfatase activity